MNGKVGKIRCKGCNREFADASEYLACNGCEKDECPMGKKWKARQAANAAIEKAQGTAKEEVFLSHVKTCHMPDQHDENLPYRERPMSHCICFHVMKR